MIIGETVKVALSSIYVGNELPEYELVSKKTGSVITRLLKIADENTVADT